MQCTVTGVHAEIYFEKYYVSSGFFVWAACQQGKGEKKYSIIDYY